MKLAWQWKQRLLHVVADQRVVALSCWRRWWSWIAARRSRERASERRWELVRSDADDLLRFRVARKRLVVAQVNVVHVANLPALTAEVATKRFSSNSSTRKSNLNNSPEAREFAAVVGTVLHGAQRAERVLQVRVDLHLLRELWSFDFDESSRHCAHVGAGVVESDAPGADWIFVFVGVDAGVDLKDNKSHRKSDVPSVNKVKCKLTDAVEKVIHDLCQCFGCQLAVKSADEYSLGRIKLLICVLDVVRVTDDPRNDFNLLFLDALRRDFVVIVSVGVSRN